jgi:chemotaxis protein CheY-P-specific phosphatase CheC
MMTVSEDVLKELSANMLGVDDEETTKDQRHDALKETMNILCGNLLPAIAGKEAVFDIGAPKIEGEEGFPEPSDDPGSESAVSLNIDDEYCNLRLFLKGEVPQDVHGRDA